MPAKDPRERLILPGLDFGPLISQPIVQIDHTAEGVCVIAAALTGSVVVYTVIGGQDGTPASIVTTVTLRDRQRITRAVRLPIVSQGGPAPAADPDALVVNGMPLQSGRSPLTVTPGGLDLMVNGGPLLINGDPLKVES